jgi:hypothetical protein
VVQQGNETITSKRIVVVKWVGNIVGAIPQPRQYPNIR